MNFLLVSENPFYRLEDIQEFQASVHEHPPGTIVNRYTLGTEATGITHITEVLFPPGDTHDHKRTR